MLSHSVYLGVSIGPCKIPFHVLHRRRPDFKLARCRQREFIVKALGSHERRDEHNRAMQRLYISSSSHSTCNPIASGFLLLYLNPSSVPSHISNLSLFNAWFCVPPMHTLIRLHTTSSIKNLFKTARPSKVFPRF